MIYQQLYVVVIKYCQEIFTEQLSPVSLVWLHVSLDVTSVWLEMEKLR